MSAGILRTSLTLLLSFQLAVQPVLASFTNIQSGGDSTARDFKVLLDVQPPTFSDSSRNAMVDTNGNPLNLGGAYDPFAIPYPNRCPRCKCYLTTMVHITRVQFRALWS